MKRLSLISILLVVLSFTARASHITGGEMYYTFKGIISGMYQYEVTLKLFQRCGSGRQFTDPTIVSIFDKTTNVRVSDLSVPITNRDNISITNPDPCISNPPAVCYDVAYYTFTISLPGSPAGYVIASQVNYRINGITNLSSGYNNIGATFTAEIPGTANVANGPENNSAVFTGSDLVIVCANNDFSYSFAAQDADGDELRYFFCEAYASTAGAGGGAQPTAPPPFPAVPYGAPFGENAPLGPTVQINSATGLITGIAPSGGIYVVTVCVDETRNGILIARQRKDIQINIADCNIAAATLLPEYMLCRNTQTITIANQSSSPLIVSTDWEFFDNTNALIYSVSGPSATYTFPAIGLYTIKLVINRGQGCTDSTTTVVRVFPGFMPGFTSTGICFNRPTFFTDNTSSVYGTPNSWTWDFGEPSTTIDISSQQNPAYTYPSMGVKSVRLIATDTRGCRDTVYRDMTIIDKPPVNLAFRDTLICINDNLVLQASGSGNFSWSPPVNIVNPTTATPTVSPPTTTTYYVDLEENGCLNRDSVKVRVVNFVTLQAMADTTICRGDTIQLRAISDGLQYSWSPSSQLINPTIQNPFSITNNASTNYQVTAIIGGCSATDNVLVTTVPYPTVNAGPDFTICYNAKAQLNGITDGSSWQWTPVNLVSNPAILNPVSYPPRTTDYVLTAFDIRGCPKPSRDTINVTVLPKMRVSAGRDTVVIVGQPLQLNATGGINYDWIPATYLSDADISNPVALFPNPSTGIQYKVIAFSQQGCKDSAFITIKVFKTQPTVFVPSAFTPNNDGKNDVLRPIAVGIKDIEYFNIYNRWGQLLFSTKVNGFGWNGKIGGVLQSTGTFVWTVKATDYTGKAYFQKGVVTLIR
jgi:gliding motility-associated-like protein